MIVDFRGWILDLRGSRDGFGGPQYFHRSCALFRSSSPDNHDADCPLMLDEGALSVDRRGQLCDVRCSDYMQECSGTFRGYQEVGQGHPNLLWVGGMS
jgi:hypothetical protein